MTGTPHPHTHIIARDRRAAHFPDGLCFYTFPIRREAIRRLGLVPGGPVLEAG